MYCEDDFSCYSCDDSVWWRQLELVYVCWHSTSAEGADDDRDEGPGEEDVVDPATVEYEAGNYSPQLIRPSDLPPDTIVFDSADDIKRLEFARHQILVTGQLQVSYVM